ncbi:MAG: carbohydrate ABC transporter permease [Verrucomicrobiota bacterium]
MRIVGRIIIYLLLISGSFIFLFPLFWMISTALKPIDQTMSMPPVWVPYREFAELNGKVVSVKRGDTIDAPSFVVRLKKTGERTIVPQAAVIAGEYTTKTKDGDELRRPVEVLKEIPASMAAPWVKVMAEVVSDDPNAPVVNKEAAAAWDLVPVTALVKKAAPRWDNFPKAVRAMKEFRNYLKNTLILCFLTVIGTVSSSAVAAYGFAKVNWRGRNAVFAIALATMMIPFPVVMVPIYCLFRWIGWIGTLRPLWAGSFLAGAFNVFLLRQFFMTIPKDLSDAAKIDGCSEWRIFWQIMLPLSRPALMVIGLFQFMGTWNDFLGPLIYLTNQKDFTLALGLQFFQSQHGGTQWHYLMAASTLVVLPIIVLFFFTQKTFIEGISMTGIKG